MTAEPAAQATEMSAAHSATEVATAHPTAEMTATHPTAEMTATHSTAEMTASATTATTTAAARPCVGRDAGATHRYGHRDHRDFVQREYPHDISFHSLDFDSRRRSASA
jgi:hypothetical protein